MNLTAERYSVECKTRDKQELDKFLSVVGNDSTKSYSDSRWIISRDTMAGLLKIIPEKMLDIIPVFKVGEDMKLALYDYQQEVVEFGIKNGSALLALPCGAGKSAILIDLFLDLKKAGKISQDAKCLIVVKSSIKLQWLDEISKFSDLKANIIETFKQAVGATLPKKLKAAEKAVSEAHQEHAQLNSKLASAKILERGKYALLASKAKDKLLKLMDERDTIQSSIKNMFEGQFSPDYDIYIANYETLRDADVRKQLHKMKLEMVGADEVHLIKDYKAVRSKALCEFADVKFRFGATATPIKKNPMDAFGISKFIAPTAFKSVTDFKNSFVNFNIFGGVSGAKNESLLNRELSKFMVVKTKEEIAKQLPEVVVITRNCQLTDKQTAMHEQLMEEIKELKDSERDIMTKYRGKPPADDPDLVKTQAGILARQTFAAELADTEELLQISDSDMAKRYITGSKSGKMELLLDLLEEIIDSGEKVVIFSRYRKLQPIIEREIKNRMKEVNVAFVNGELSAEERHTEVYTKFRDDDSYKVLIMSDAGAEGISISWCKYLIEMEPADSYLIQTQRRGRIERADSIHSTVYVYQLIAEESFDEISLKIIDKKESYDSRIIKGNL